MCFLRCFLLFSAVFSISHQVSVFHETPNISETDECRLSCGTKGQLPLTEIDGGFYYFYVDTANQKNWHEAYDFCRQHNMELVTIETAAENEALKQNMKGLKSKSNK
ncbi:hypothetical protein B566_EDAN015405 [Ephemera danica]|nr:hypothetical protein B566_EDAN015405 [Ephemera danica]